MSQTVPAAVQLGFAYAGADGIGVRTVRLDKTTVVTANTIVGVAEAPANTGQFQRAGGVEAHEEGGYIVWTQNGTDVLWGTIAPAAPTVSGDGKIEFPYTLTDSVANQPIPDASIRITTDVAMLNTIWTGTTNVLGVARNLCGELPRLAPGTYYFVREHPNFVFANPDTEIVG